MKGILKQNKKEIKSAKTKSVTFVPDTKFTELSAEINANFTAYMTKNTVSVSINERKTNALCDTGATISCVGLTFLDKIFPTTKPDIKNCSLKTITGVGGTHHSVQGFVNLDVNFGGLTIGYPFYIVKDLHHSLILGHDFMERHNVNIDYKQNSFTFKTV